VLEILLAGALFVGTHFGLSSTGVRPRLVAALGERGFLVFYSLVSAATLGFLIYLYGNLPRFDYLWTPSPTLYLVAKLIMPVAMILLLGGFLARNPTAVGMADQLDDPALRDDPARGLARITRHPFQWSVVLWAVAHLIANGDTHSVAFFSAFLVLSLGGTVLIDRKKAAGHPEGWRAYAAATSNLPFAAIATGRNRLVLRELWLPVAVGLAGYALTFWGHEWVGGVRIY